MSMFREEFYIVEELKEKKGKFSVSIIRSVRYGTIGEAEAELKKNGTDRKWKVKNRERLDLRMEI